VRGIKETKVELHSMRCSCGDGAWAVGEATVRSRCPGGIGLETEVLTLEEWQRQGKPRNLERLHRVAARGEFPRYEGKLRRS
jgi:hypothetical protein